MKFNLYIPDAKTKRKWEKYAQLANRSLSQFIRLAVNEKIQRMEREER